MTSNSSAAECHCITEHSGLGDEKWNFGVLRQYLSIMVQELQIIRMKVTIMVKAI